MLGPILDLAGREAMRDELTDIELRLMRRIAGGVLTSIGSVEDDRVMAALRKRGLLNSNGLSNKGWNALREVDDDTWSV